MKIFVQYILVLALATSAAGQSYHPVIENDKTWNILTMTWAQFNTSTYSFIGDTIISNHAYKKLYSENKYNESEIYLGAIREDAGMQKVFYRDRYATDEGLLYDFSLLTGDTITIYSNPEAKGIALHYTVDSVGHVADENGNSRKRMYMTAYSYKIAEEWVEGIGSMQGLISPGNLFYMADLNYELLCSKLEGEVLYYNPSRDTCFMDPVDIPENNPPSTAIQIFPNPVTDVSVLQLSNNSNENLTLEIYDFKGQLLRKISFSGTKFLLAKEDYSTGIFFLKVSSPNKEFAIEKFVVW